MKAARINDVVVPLSAVKYVGRLTSSSNFNEPPKNDDEQSVVAIGLTGGSCLHVTELGADLEEQRAELLRVCDELGLEMPKLRPPSMLKSEPVPEPEVRSLHDIEPGTEFTFVNSSHGEGAFRVLADDQLPATGRTSFVTPIGTLESVDVERHVEVQVLTRRAALQDGFVVVRCDPEDSPMGEDYPLPGGDWHADEYFRFSAPFFTPASWELVAVPHVVDGMVVGFMMGVAKPEALDRG